jgi:hypothetical protein
MIKSVIRRIRTFYRLISQSLEEYVDTLLIRTYITFFRIGILSISNNLSGIIINRIKIIYRKINRKKTNSKNNDYPIVDTRNIVVEDMQLNFGKHKYTRKKNKIGTNGKMKDTSDKDHIILFIHYRNKE